MANYIKVTVIAKDGISLIGCPTNMHLPCPEGSVIDGRDFYFQSDNLQQTWNFPPQLLPAVLPAVSFPTAKIISRGHTYYVIADQDESPAQAVNQIIADLCNACCATSPGGEADATAGAPGNIIPTLLFMSNGDSDQNCATGVCTYSYYDTLPTDSTVTYSISFAHNGVNSTSGSTKFTTKAAALAYAVANFGSFGSWSLVGQQLKVTGSTSAVGKLYHTNF